MQKSTGRRVHSLECMVLGREVWVAYAAERTPMDHPVHGSSTDAHLGEGDLAPQFQATPVTIDVQGCTAVFRAPFRSRRA